MSRFSRLTVQGVVIFDSRGKVIWITKPAVGAKSDYLGVSAWEYAATVEDIYRVQIAWTTAMTGDGPVTFSMDTHPNIVPGSWQHTYQRIDASPIIVAEWRELIRNPLAKREQEIAILFASDWKSGEIAENLGITTNTVETVRKRILHKTGTRGIAGMTRWLIKAGIIDG